MSILKIGEKNQIYYEYIEPKDNCYTFIFVNALTGDVSAWNGFIGENVVKNNDGLSLIHI